MFARALLLLLLPVIAAHLASSSAGRSNNPSRYELKFQNDLDNSTIHKIEAQQQIFKCQVRLAPVPIKSGDASPERSFRLKSSSKLLFSEHDYKTNVADGAPLKWPANVTLAIDWIKDDRPLVQSDHLQDGSGGTPESQVVAVINVELRSGNNSNSNSNGASLAANDKNRDGGSGNNNKNKSRIEIKNTLNGQQMKLTSRLRLSQLRISDSGKYKCIARGSFQVPISGQQVQTTTTTMANNDQVESAQRLVSVEQTLDSSGAANLVVANKTGEAGSAAFTGSNGRNGKEGKFGMQRLRESRKNDANRFVSVGNPALATLASQRGGNDTQHATMVPNGYRDLETMATSSQQRQTPSLAPPEGPNEISGGTRATNQMSGPDNDELLLLPPPLQENGTGAGDLGPMSSAKQASTGSGGGGSGASGIGSSGTSSSFADDEDLFKIEQQQPDFISNQQQQQQQHSSDANSNGAMAKAASTNDDEDQEDELASGGGRRTRLPLGAQSTSIQLADEDPPVGLSLADGEWAAPASVSSPNGNDIQAQPDDNTGASSNNINNIGMRARWPAPINQSLAGSNETRVGDLVIGLRRNISDGRARAPLVSTNCDEPPRRLANSGSHGQWQANGREVLDTSDGGAPMGTYSSLAGSLDSTRLRLARLVHKIAPADELSCYTGYGEHYRGNVSVSADHRPCLDWAHVWRALGAGGQRALAAKLGLAWNHGDAKESLVVIAAAAAADGHNHCRNPNMESRGPWCFVQYSETLDAGQMDERLVLVSATRNATSGSSEQATLCATRYVQRACSISACSDYLWLYIVAPPLGLLMVFGCLALVMIRAVRKSHYQSMVLACGKKTLPGKLNKLLLASGRFASSKRFSSGKGGSGAASKKTCPNYMDDDIFEIVNDIDWSDGSAHGSTGQVQSISPKSTESLKLHSSSFSSSSGNELSGCKSINPLFNDKALDGQKPLAGFGNRSTTTTSQIGPMFATLRCHIREKKPIGGKLQATSGSSTSTFIEPMQCSDPVNKQQKPPVIAANPDWLSSSDACPSSPTDSELSPESSGVGLDFSSGSSRPTGGSHLISCSSTTDDIESIDCCGEKCIRAVELPQLSASSVSICLDQQQQPLYEGRFNQVQMAYLRHEKNASGETTDRLDIGAQVAVHSLKPNAVNVIDPKLFKPNNLKLRNLNHLNLLKLIGYAHLSQDEIGLNKSPRFSSCCSLIYDMAKLVDLSDWLKQHNKDLIVSDEPANELGTRRNLTCFAKQIALAIDYLHDHKIVYKDLACRNCFLDPTKMLVKLASFNQELVVTPNGASGGAGGDHHQAQNLKSMIRPKYLHDYYVIDSRPTDCQLVSLGCTPLESILFNKFNKQTDVWSFGCLLYELFSFGEAAYFGYSSKQVIDSVRANLMPPQPLLCPNGIYKLMCKCLSDIPSVRPNIKQIYEQLNLYSGQCSSFLDHHLCSLATSMYDDQSPGGAVGQLVEMKSSQSHMCANPLLSRNNNILITTTTTSTNTTASRDNSITRAKSYANMKNCSSPSANNKNHGNNNGNNWNVTYENQVHQSASGVGSHQKTEFAKIPSSKSINLGAGARLMNFGAQNSMQVLGASNAESNHYDEPVVESQGGNRCC